MDGAPMKMEIIEGTEEQEAVWKALLTTLLHVIVEAVAGSGKTFTLIQYALREKVKRIGLVAFNKHIADELKLKMGGTRDSKGVIRGGQSNVDCMTYHSLGFKAVREFTRGRTQVDDYKVLNYLDTVEMARIEKGVKKLLSREEVKLAKYRIKSMVSYAKNYGFGWDISEEQLNYIEERHDVELNGLKDIVYAHVGPTLKWCAENLTSIDYDDMVWVPYILDLPVPQYDVLCVDEYQDTAITQQWLALKAGKRVCAVGDSRQAIYGFRGADSRGFDRLREKLGNKVVTLPLTLTRRCPKSHVALAQRIVPQIRALDDAPEGLISYMPTEAAVDSMRVGDLVVCRVNAPLLSTAYQLLKRGAKAVVRGRDLGAGIEKLLEMAQKSAEGSEDLAVVLANASTITASFVDKFNNLPNGRGEMRAMAAQDKFDCLAELAAQCGTLRELRGLLSKLFAEFDDDGKPINAVVFGTVHRTKGLEGNRVFVLKPELIPHPMAKRKADHEQERNLGYVAVTRAKFEDGKPGELVFVGGESDLFPKQPSEDFDDGGPVALGGWQGAAKREEDTTGDGPALDSCGDVVLHEVGGDRVTTLNEVLEEIKQKHAPILAPDDDEEDYPEQEEQEQQERGEWE
jgi:superfamily I DNA/RNA helicase